MSAHDQPAANDFVRRAAPDLEPGEIIRIRARYYRVAGHNAYGEAMLTEINHVKPGEAERATEGSGIRGC